MLLHPAPDAETDAFRLFSGARFVIDTLGGHWLVETRDAPFPDEVTASAEGVARSLWWKRLEVSAKESPVRVTGEVAGKPFTVREHGVNYEVSLQSGYSQGLFLDQRLNRLEVRERCRAGDRILNTFAYTGAFSVVAALARATTTSLDLSKPYLEWAKRNLAGNGVDPAAHYFTRGDTLEWLPRWRRSGVRFHGIVLDPPTFSRNGRGNVFRVEKDYGSLVEMALGVLEPGGWILCCSNCRQLSGARFMDLVEEGRRNSGARALRRSMRPMPPEYGGADYLKTVWVDT